MRRSDRIQTLQTDPILLSRFKSAIEKRALQIATSKESQDEPEIAWAKRAFLNIDVDLSLKYAALALRIALHENEKLRAQLEDDDGPKGLPDSDIEEIVGMCVERFVELGI